MPQLLLLAAVGIGAYAGYRWLKSKQHKSDKPNPASRSDSARDAGDLIWDEKKGAYRPRD